MAKYRKRPIVIEAEQFFPDILPWPDGVREVIHGDERVRADVTSEAREWFNKNNLFLPPQIRNDLDQIINNVINYRDELEAHYEEKQHGDREKARKLYEEVKNNFKRIITLPKRIQKSVDIYYEIDKNARIKKLLGILRKKDHKQNTQK